MDEHRVNRMRLSFSTAALLLVACSEPRAECAGLAQQGQVRLQRPSEGSFTTGYGLRMHPILGVRRPHLGIDIVAPAGTPVVAAAGGMVTRAGPDGEYGNAILISHGRGLETFNAHLSRFAVRTGDCIAAGATVGFMGATGLSTGPHLHFEVHRGGQIVDPANYMDLGPEQPGLAPK